MRKFYPLLIFPLAIFVLSISSCVDEYNGGINDVESNLFVFAELEAGEQLELRVLKTSAFGEPTNIQFPEDAVVILDFGAGSARILYDASKDMYCEELITIEENKDYSIDVTLERSSLDDITASTTVPVSKGFETAAIFKSSNDLDQLELNFSIAFDDMQLEDYYHVLPYFYISKIVGTDTIVGIEKHYVKFGSLPRDLDNINSLAHRDGVIFNGSSIDGNEIAFKGLAGVTLESDEVIENITIETRTTDMSYFHYHKQLSKQILLDQTNLGEPVLVGSNVVNGYGLFGSFSKDVKIMILQ